MNLRSITFGAILLLLLASCNSEGGKITVKPKALGVMNEILVITDADLWKSVIGDTIQDIYEGYYPITHRPEPIFNLRYFTPQEISQEPLRRELRTYMIVANLANEESATTQMVKEDLGLERFNKALTDPSFNSSVGKDKWAHGQIILYVFANGVDALSKALVENFDGISSRVNEHDLIQLNSKTYAAGENLGLATELEAKYGARVIIPIDFDLALSKPEENKLMWYRKDFAVTWRYKESVKQHQSFGTMNIVFREFDYTGPEMVLPKAAKKRFDDFGIHVTSDQPNTSIIINDVDLPLLSYDRIIDGRYAKEYRGIWEMENDFIGGAYIGYILINEKTNKALVIDGFVQAEDIKKRDILQQLDRIIRRITWI